MQKIYKEILDDSMVDLLESLNYEVETRKSLLGFLSEQTTYNKDIFNEIFSEYQDFFIQYDIAKKDFEYSYIRKKYTNIVCWNLTFYNKELSITVNEEEEK